MDENKKSWKDTWWGAIVLIILLPFTLTILVWSNKYWSKKLRVGLIIALWIIVLAKTSSNTESTAANTNITPTLTITTTAATRTTIVNTVTSKPIETAILPKNTPIPTIKPITTIAPTITNTPIPTMFSPTNTPALIQQNSGNSNTSKFTCNCSRTCGSMTCEEAYYQLDQCGCSARDGDNDGIPCETVCSH